MKCRNKGKCNTCGYVRIDRDDDTCGLDDPYSESASSNIIGVILVAGASFVAYWGLLHLAMWLTQ